MKKLTGEISRSRDEYGVYGVVFDNLNEGDELWEIHENDLILAPVQDLGAPRGRHD